MTTVYLLPSNFNNLANHKYKGVIVYVFGTKCIIISDTDMNDAVSTQYIMGLGCTQGQPPWRIFIKYYSYYGGPGEEGEVIYK